MEMEAWFDELTGIPLGLSAGFLLLPRPFPAWLPSKPDVMEEKASLAPGPWKPQFFRILLPGFHRRLSIPRPFNKYISRDDCTAATILSPLGNSWPVRVHGDSNHLYFGEGWEEFCLAHDLYAGCFLVFSYEDEMVFRVTIFDSSSCMKEYDTVMEDTDMENETGEGSSSLDEAKIAESSEPQIDSHEQQATGMVESIASQEQSAPNKIGSSSEVSCKITIRSHSLLKPNLHIPKVFQKSSGISSVNNVILRDPKMRLWPTTIYHRRRRRNFHSRLGYGWAKFCTSNNVEEGDVCIFETLPGEEKFTIHVSILKKPTVQQAFGLIKPCPEDQCPVIRNTPIENTTGERTVEHGQINGSDASQLMNHSMGIFPDGAPWPVANG